MKRGQGEKTSRQSCVCRLSCWCAEEWRGVGTASGEHSATRCLSAAAESNSMTWHTHPERHKAALSRCCVARWLLPPFGEAECALALESHAAVGVARALTRP